MPSAITSAFIAIAGQLADGVVTEPKIASGAVTNTKVGADAITADKIGAGEVGASEIASSAVGSDELATGAVIAGKIAAGGIDNANNFAAGVVDNAAIADSAVNANKLAGSAVTSSKIATQNVVTAKIADGDVTGKKLGESSRYGLPGDEAIMSDDGVITPGSTTPRGFLWIQSRTDPQNAWGFVHFEYTPTTFTAIIAGGSNFEVTTGSLDGTTGTDGKLTFSIDSFGQIFIENRLGASSYVLYGFLGNPSPG